MGKKSHSGIKEPPALIYGAARWILRFFCRVFLGYRVQYQDYPPAKGPLIVLGSHPGMLDSLFMAAAIRNRRLHFVTTERFFRMRFVGWLFRAFGVIPRIQFHPDPRSISAMMRIARNGGAIGLFPAGQTSMYGQPGNISPTIVRLLKKCHATVVTLNLHGSFFTKARFASGMPARGRVDGLVRVLYTPEALEAAPDREVYEAVCDALFYDEFEWQQRTGVTFSSPSRARGYERSLFYCPRCNKEHQMASRGHRFFCQACGNAAIVGPDMRMTPESPDCVIFPTMKEWYQAQQAQLFAWIDDPGREFALEAETDVELYNGNDRYHASEGRLFMDREGLRFEGELNGRPAGLRIRHANLPGMASEVGAYMELYDKDYDLVRYLPKNPRVIAQWKMAQEYLYGKTMEL